MATATITPEIQPDLLPSGIEITEHLRARWLAERKFGIGASEAPAILGLDPYCSPLEVYCRKIGAIEESTEPTEAQWFGLALEPVLEKAYERRTGQKIVRRQLFHRVGRLFATADAVTADYGLVEFKTVNPRNRAVVEQLGRDGTDEIPPSWMAQVQHQIYLAGRAEAEIAVLVGGNDFRIFRVERHQPFIDDVLLPRLTEFWERVQNEDPPPAVAEDLSLITRLHDQPAGEIALDQEAAQLWDDYLRYQAVSEVASEIADACRARFEQLMEDHAIAVFPGGRKVRRSVVHCKEAHVPAFTRKASTYSRLKEITTNGK